MNDIKVLDCTLRDGGYINDFAFGEKVISEVICRLAGANVDIIECGFLKSGCYDKDKSLFGNIAAVKKVIGAKNKDVMYVAMIQYGAISIDEIQEYDGYSIDGIRVTFHEHEIEDALVLGRQLMEKGYKVFMQPVGTTTYEDDNLICLIKKINALNPFAFYIVDTLGLMYKNDLLRLFYIVDHNLDRSISLGFHSHNNLQMSFANAQELTQLNTPRNLIIDSSVLGMGRGAGNLNTELLVQYLNTNFMMKYSVPDIMSVLDEFIRPLKVTYDWGYDVAYFVAAIAGCHPNYAAFLLNVHTLPMQDINAILNGLDDDKKALYNKEYINRKYKEYMAHEVDDVEALKYLSGKLGERKVLLLALGKSLKDNMEKIKNLIEREKYYVVSVNFKPSELSVDMIFISNMKRFHMIEETGNDGNADIVVTSNVLSEGRLKTVVVNYSSYLNENEYIYDNAGIMCINMFERIGIKNFLLAGYDGFSSDLRKNFYEKNLFIDVDQDRISNINAAMKEKFEQLQKYLDIEFLK